MEVYLYTLLPRLYNAVLGLLKEQSDLSHHCWLRPRFLNTVELQWLNPDGLFIVLGSLNDPYETSMVIFLHLCFHAVNFIYYF